MKRFGLAVNRVYQTGLMVLLALCAVPAWAQEGGGTDVNVTTQETTSTETWVSDWRIWALVGAVVLVILVIALSRGRGESSTTVVK
jgi:multisubunit Na+/H+ antiporter MnhB subunit